VKFRFRQSVDELRRISTDADPRLFKQPIDCERAKRLASEAASQLEHLPR